MARVVHDDGEEEGAKHGALRNAAGHLHPTGVMAVPVEYACRAIT